jgi:outer membrane protein OmpA-like peptidoglycan-associated protein
MKRMKIGLVVGAVLATLGIGGCMSTPPLPIGFNYQVDNRQANRIVQVFDLSGNTVVQIRNVDAKTTRFYNSHNVEIPYKIVGENVVFNGLQTSFTVSSRRAASRVVRTAPVPGEGTSSNLAQAAPVAAAAAGPAKAAAGEQTGDEQVLAEIARMKKELAELKEMLAATELPGANSPATLVQSAPAPAEPQAEVVRVSFANNSQSFAPPREVGAYLVEMAKSAKTVEVRGFTDSAQASATSQALAKGRAAAAKRFLVRHGVDASKVRVEYEPAGKFATENLTIEGKATNRRVEIRAS